MTYAQLTSLVASCSADNNLSRPAGGWDTLASFAESLSMDFPTGARENILRLAAVTAAKGKFSGQSARWGSGYKFSEAWKAYITGAVTPDAAKSRRGERAQFTKCARLYAALGGTEFVPAGE